MTLQEQIHPLQNKITERLSELYKLHEGGVTEEILDNDPELVELKAEIKRIVTGRP